MSKMLLLVLTFLISAAVLQAHDQSSQAGSSQTGAAASGQTTVEGCLQGSKGAYTLTDNSGMTYQLQGDTSKLGAHVGHEVQITGSTAGSSATSSSVSGSASGAQQATLTVQKMKHVSTSCKSAK